jgi:hypothetical protein
MCNARIYQYGGGLFSGSCQLCGEPLKMPSQASVNQFMQQHLNKTPHYVSAQCKEHGVVEAPFVGFEKGGEDNG